MVRSLSRFAVFAALMLAASVAKSAPLAVTDLSTFRICLEQATTLGAVTCKIDEPVRAFSRGAATITGGIFSATLSTTRKIDLVIQFEAPGCLIWEHQAAAPATGNPANTATPVEIVRISAPAGVVPGGSIRFENLCVRHTTDGVDGGQSANLIDGIVVTGAGASKIQVLATQANVTLDGSVGSRPLVGVFSAPNAGKPIDLDGDGKFEQAMIWDADGDGSYMQTCTGKDAPDGICKAAGEQFLVDFADDYNCSLHGCGHGQMSKTGELYLPVGIMVEWPCYDFQQRTNFNQRGLTNDDRHDQTSDIAYTRDCPNTPDTGTTRRFIAPSSLGWQGKVIGMGEDTRDFDRTPGAIRNRGTYIVNDMGPSWQTGAQAGLNSWFGLGGFVRGFNVGFQAGQLVSTSDPVNAGETSVDGGGKGYGVARTAQTVEQIVDNQGICVLDTAGMSTAVAGDVLEVKASSGTNVSLNSQTAVVALRVRDVPQGACQTTGILIPIGGRVGQLGTNWSYFGSVPPYATRIADGAPVALVRPDYFDSRITISNLNFESQDYWDEPNGDCQETSVTTGPWTPGQDADSTNVDIDCDTNPMIGLWGAGSPVLENVTIKNWHEFAIDGDSNAGYPLIRRVRYFGGRGGAIGDGGSGWVWRDLEIRNTQFAGVGLSQFGPGQVVQRVRIVSTSANFFTSLSEIATDGVYEDIRSEGSTIRALFQLTCGARRNRITNSVQTNTHGIGIPISAAQGSLFSLECSDVNNPIQGNVFDGFATTGVQFAQQFSGNGVAAVWFQTLPTQAAPNTLAIRNNVFSHGSIITTKLNMTACLFAAADEDVSATSRTTANNWNHEDVFENNVFLGNTARATGGGTAADLVYCGSKVNSAGSGGANHQTLTPITGGATGGIPRGCLNIDSSVTGGKPAIEVCS